MIFNKFKLNKMSTLLMYSAAILTTFESPLAMEKDDQQRPLCRSRLGFQVSSNPNLNQNWIVDRPRDDRDLPPADAQTEELYLNQFFQFIQQHVGTEDRLMSSEENLARFQFMYGPKGQTLRIHYGSLEKAWLKKHDILENLQESYPVYADQKENKQFLENLERIKNEPIYDPYYAHEKTEHSGGLPHELWKVIFGYIHGMDLSSVKKVNREFYSLGQREQLRKNIQNIHLMDRVENNIALLLKGKKLNVPLNIKLNDLDRNLLFDPNSEKKLERVAPYFSNIGILSLESQNLDWNLAQLIFGSDHLKNLQVISFKNCSSLFFMSFLSVEPNLPRLKELDLRYLNRNYQSGELIIQPLVKFLNKNPSLNKIRFFDDAEFYNIENYWEFRESFMLQKQYISETLNIDDLEIKTKFLRSLAQNYITFYKFEYDLLFRFLNESKDLSIPIKIRLINPNPLNLDEILSITPYLKGLSIELNQNVQELWRNYYDSQNGSLAEHYINSIEARDERWNNLSEDEKKIPLEVRFINVIASSNNLQNLNYLSINIPNASEAAGVLFEKGIFPNLKQSYFSPQYFPFMYGRYNNPILFGEEDDS